MRVVCDTNILISGILFGGKPREILHLCSTGTLDNFISPDILKEIELVLLRPKFGLRDEQVYEIIQLFRNTFTLVTPESRLTVITADPDDNRILEAAHAAKANAIISGDAHLLKGASIYCRERIQVQGERSAETGVYRQYMRIASTAQQSKCIAEQINRGALDLATWNNPPIVSADTFLKKFI